MMGGSIGGGVTASRLSFSSSIGGGGVGGYYGGVGGYGSTITGGGGAIPFMNASIGSTNSSFNAMGQSQNNLFNQTGSHRGVPAGGGPTTSSANLMSGSLSHLNNNPSRSISFNNNTNFNNSINLPPPPPMHSSSSSNNFVCGPLCSLGEAVSPADQSMGGGELQVKKRLWTN